LLLQGLAGGGLSPAFTVENKLTGDGETRVEVPAGSTDSFKPDGAASAVPAPGGVRSAGGFFGKARPRYRRAAAYCIFRF